MYKRLLLLILILLLSDPVGARCAAALANQRDSDAEEYAVYSALIDKVYAREGAKLVILADYPSWDVHAREGHQYLRTLMPSVPEEMRNDYEARNKRAYRLKERLNVKVPYLLVSVKGCRELSRSRERKEYRALCPDLSWSMTLSRVGFNGEKNQAVVYVGIRCRGLCGSGEYLLLEKEEGAWEIRERRRVWAS
jgi:hypothetical protein